MSVTSTCARCGEPIAAGAHFCARCGADVSGEQGNLATALLQQTALQQTTQLEALRQATLGDYDLVGELGRGGMATVYLAHEIALDRKVAIKVMSPALLSGEGMIERFKREARTAASLSHPHIIPIYAVKESEQTLYFVMKFIEGRPLDSIIKEVGILAIPMVQAILYQVGSALGYAHRRGIVHRDMKPANIMVDADGWAIVTDFGIAKVSEAHGLTVTGATVGTPSYMSPEQCAAKKELTGASDQYSLGIVAYEMLTGRLPFVADSMMGIMYAHFHEPPPPVTQHRAECPRDVATALMRMLEKDPEKRWPTVEDAVTALGGGPLAHDDPIRTQLMALAAKGATAQLAKTLSTPVSPLPPGRMAGPKGTVPSTKTATAKTAAAAAAPAAPRARRVPIVAWGVPVAAAAVALWWFGLRPREEIPTSASVSPPVVALADTVAPVAPAAPAAPGAAPAAAPSSRRTEPPPDTAGSAPVQPRPSAEPQSRREAPSAEPPAPAAPPPAPPATATRRGEGLYRIAQARGLAKRLRAASAGASATDLAAGDAAAREADALARDGRFPEGQSRLEGALTLWGEAERAARARAAEERAQPPTDAAPAPAPPAAAAPSAAAQPDEARGQIEAVVATYARALETQRVPDVRRVYPGLTSRQEQGMREFFRRVRNLKVNLQVSGLERSGDRAEARVNGTYEYLNLRTNTAERLPVAFQASFQRLAPGWRLTSIH